MFSSSFVAIQNIFDKISVTYLNFKACRLLRMRKICVFHSRILYIKTIITLKTILKNPVCSANFAFSCCHLVCVRIFFPMKLVENCSVGNQRNFFSEGIRKPPKRWRLCIEKEGQNFEKWLRVIYSFYGAF